MNMLKMIGKIKEVLTWVWIAVIGTAICVNVCAQTPQEWKGLERQLNFYMANDLGRNVQYFQPLYRRAHHIWQRFLYMYPRLVFLHYRQA